MKTLGEIISLTKKNGKPEYEELRYAVCALSALLNFSHSDIFRLVENKDKKVTLFTPENTYEEQFNRNKKAFNTPPKEWLGPNYDPENPEYIKRQEQTSKFIDKFMEKEQKC